MSLAYTKLKKANKTDNFLFSVNDSEVETSKLLLHKYMMVRYRNKQ